MMRTFLLSILVAGTVLAEPVFIDSEAHRLSVTTVDPKGATSVVVRVDVPIAGIDELWTPDQIKPVQDRKWWITKLSAPQCDFPYAAYFASNGDCQLVFSAPSD